MEILHDPRRPLVGSCWFCCSCRRRPMRKRAITGVVRDTSGGVLPGVTVEAASPVLIEKVRSVVSDDTGQYRIVDLRPGTYSVTFTLPGFSTVKREGIELTGTFVATVNGDLKVGALEETITVTGETPIVDVQSARVQQTVSKDILAAIPSSRNAGGIQALIPGMSTRRRFRRHHRRTMQRRRRDHPRRSRQRFAHLCTTASTRGGPAAARAAGTCRNVAGAQEVVVSTSGGLGEAETAGVVLNVIPRDGGNTFSGPFNFSRRERRDAGQQLHAGAARTRACRRRQNSSACTTSIRWAAAGSSGTSSGSTSPIRQTGSREHGPGHVVQQERRQPECLDGRFRPEPASVQRHPGPERDRRITWQVTPRNKINLHWSEQYNDSATKGGGTATTTPEASGRTLFQPSHIQQATWSSPVTSRLLLEAGWGTYEARYRNPAAAARRHPQRPDDPGAGTGRRDPGLTSRMPAGVGGGFNHHLIGTLANGGRRCRMSPARTT